jgi:hypothetical protein
MLGAANKSFNVIPDSKNGTIMTVLERFNRLLLAGNITPLIDFNRASSMLMEVNYKECSDDGGYVGFGGLMVNTESLCAVLGYSGNNSGYIPLFNVAEMLGIFLFGEEKKSLIGKDEAKYIIESFKLDYKGFSIVEYAKTLVEGTTTALEFKSVLMNYRDNAISKPTVKKDTLLPIYLWDDEELIDVITKFIKSLLVSIDDIAKEFFDNFAPEANTQEVMSNMKKDMTSLLKGTAKTTSLEALFLKNISEAKVPPIFARELVSTGFARRSRMDIAKSDTSSKRKELAVLSSGSYADEGEGNPNSKVISVESIPDDKIATYNLLDILRGINRDQDMFFSYDVATALGNETLYKTLLNKLKIENEVNKITSEKFQKNLVNYASKVSHFMDRGFVYSKSTTQGQKDFAVFVSRSLGSAGKLVKKIADRMVSKFK